MQYLPLYLIALALSPNAIKETVALYQRLNTWYNRPKAKMPLWPPRPQEEEQEVPPARTTGNLAAVGMSSSIRSAAQDAETWRELGFDTKQRAAIRSQRQK